MRKCLEWLVRAAGHLLGVFFLWCTMMFWVLQDTGMSVAQLMQASSDGRVVESTSADVWVFFICAALLWGFMAYVWSSWSKRGRVRARMIARQAGTALTEFIIVIPIFLLLTFGLAQLMLNSMAGLLASLGAFQAGRTAMLWHQEAPASEVNQRAKMAAASVMVPVATSSFRGQCFFDPSSNMVFATKAESMATMVGQPTYNGQALAAGKPPGTHGRDFSFWVALDGGDDFADRTMVKFYKAACATDVTSDGPDITMVYRHRITMPLMGGIFGDAFGSNEYYAEIKREYSGLPSQVRPNFAAPVSLLSVVHSMGSALGINGALTDAAQPN